MSTKRDYYDILGVTKTSSHYEVKQQYRKLAIKFHPDRNQYSDTGESFKEISEATNVSINTALGRMRYALNNIRRMIKEYKIVL